MSYNPLQNYNICFVQHSSICQRNKELPHTHGNTSAEVLKKASQFRMRIAPAAKLLPATVKRQSFVPGGQSLLDNKPKQTLAFRPRQGVAGFVWHLPLHVPAAHFPVDVEKWLFQPQEQPVAGSYASGSPDEPQYAPAPSVAHNV